MLLGVAGCASQPKLLEPLPQKSISSLTKHQNNLMPIQSWQLKGRLAINYNGDSWNSTIHWQKQPNGYEIQLYLPLGQGSIQITGDRDSATLKTSDGDQTVAENGEALFYRQFGFSFPIGALHEWVIGRPDTRSDTSPDTGPDTSAKWLQQVDEHGKMRSLEQNGWHMRLPDYQSVPIKHAEADTYQLSLPRKLFLQQDDNSVRLVIQQWQLGSD